MTKLLKTCFTILAMACASTTFANSTPVYSAVVVFGDSLSDNGNLYRLVDQQTPLTPNDGQPPMPYFYGRYSNGPVAVELLAHSLGLPLIDFAYGGAQTGFNNEDPNLAGTGVLAQVSQAVQPGKRLDANALYIVWAGPNDFSSTAALVDPNTAPTAVANLSTAIKTLFGHGARHILVPNMPNFGLTPNIQAIGSDAVVAATAQTKYFNSLLEVELIRLGYALRHADIRTYDIATLLNDAYSNPASYGLLDVTSTCIHQLADGSVVVDDPSCVVDSFNAGPATRHLYWDDFHPTALVHQFIANELLSVVNH
jgi:phospholipase/lecithinase/hemolysin